jgi:hypothetical protein
MRFLLAALAVFLSPVPAAAQDAPQDPQALAEATFALSANWRPTAALTAAAFEAACAGADAEIAAVEAGLPPVLTAESLARVRSLRGLLISPADGEPGEVYVFAPPSLDWLTSGLARVRVLQASEGFLALQDAAQVDVALQRGAAGSHPVLRLRGPDDAIVTLVACAPIL